ncbi:MAG: hypothetical protein FJX72_19700, partial [Armatimonadetes bacterium]|nr:hypothetical protein [Armatimonadota bacterium]
MGAGFSLPEDPDYTLRDSARDSVRFAHRCLEPHEGARWRAVSTFVDPDYTLRDSARDSVRFAHRCLEPHEGARWRAVSTFVDPDARIQHWHDFGDLEGPGWAANGLGGAVQLYTWGAFDSCHLLQHVALGLMDHTLDDGFVQPDGFVWGYRDTASDRLCLNFP